jgi:cyclopropane fatty-acyl-phospholipid synthase-like methyltransferase
MERSAPARRVDRRAARLTADSGGEWWTRYFDEQYLNEYGALFTLERDRQEVARLIEILGLHAGARVLDVPCGQGRHAHLLAEAGFRVDGLDFSKELLARARARGVGPSLHYRRGDMRHSASSPTRPTIGPCSANSRAFFNPAARSSGMVAAGTA